LYALLIILNRASTIETMYLSCKQIDLCTAVVGPQ